MVSYSQEEDEMSQVDNIVEEDNVVVEDNRVEETFRCIGCHNDVWEDEVAVQLNDRLVICSACEEDFVLCPECGEYHRSDDTHLHCAECGGLIESNWDIGISGGGTDAPNNLCDDEVLCLSCSDEYFFCDYCRRYVNRDDDHYHCPQCGTLLLDEGDICPNCARTPESDGLYHVNPPMHYFYLDNDPMGRYIGIELEFEVDVEDDEDNRRYLVDWFKSSKFSYYFWLKSDGSLSSEGGVELCSHPMTWNYWRIYGFQLLEDLVEELSDRGASAWNQKISTCGIHLSFSNDWWEGSHHLGRTCRWIYEHNGFIHDISCRKWEQLERWANPKYYSDKWDAYKTAVKRYAPTRYLALNLSNNKRVECRIFRSSLNIERIRAYFEIVKAIIEFTRDKIGLKADITSFFAFINKQKGQYRDVLKKYADVFDKYIG